MADIASQLILHPTVSLALKYGGSTLGREKASKATLPCTILIGLQAYRAVQFLARFYAWYLLTKGDKSQADRWAALKVHLGTARKCASPGNPLINS